jgi:DNA-binding MarR family transcriptional regulator
MTREGSPETSDYVLDDNIGFLLRRCSQANTAEFAQAAPAELSPPRFAALARLVELGPLSQNRLGRLISTDAATIKGIIDRLRQLEAVTISPDPSDKRQRLVAITEKGRSLYDEGIKASRSAASGMSDHLTHAEEVMLIALLRKVADATAPMQDG